MPQDIRVRFAPSPTGYLHIGGVRTAIFNHLFARHHGGAFLLRIEDTDRERSTDQAVEQIFDSLKWLQLDWDEEPVFQSQRNELYRAHLDRLLAEGKAYRCVCTPEELERKRQQAIEEKRTYKYDGSCRDRDPRDVPTDRPHTIRFRLPGQFPTHFDDLILGAIPFDRELLDDMILARSDGSPTYNFCVVVDDADMRISHVIRGNDHVSNTPKQILLYQAFGYQAPHFAHMPLTHGPDGSKLSKRREAEYRKLGISVSVQEYRNMGYLPHALFNYLTRLGWAHGDDEILSRQELEQKFDLDGVGKSASIMNPDKLKWLNAHYLKESPTSDLAGLLLPFIRTYASDAQPGERLDRIVEALKERSKTIEHMSELAKLYYVSPEQYDERAVKKWIKPDAPVLLQRLRAWLLEADLSQEAPFEAGLKDLADQLTGGKLGKLAQPLRIALCGDAASPPLFAVIGILGVEEAVRRIDRALAWLDHV